MFPSEPSSTEGAAQCTSGANSSSKLSNHVDYMWDFSPGIPDICWFVLLPFCCWKTRPLMASRFTLEKPASFWFQLETNFSGSEPNYFWPKSSEWDISPFLLLIIKNWGKCYLLLQSLVKSTDFIIKGLFIYYVLEAHFYITQHYIIWILFYIIRMNPFLLLQ